MLTQDLTRDRTYIQTRPPSYYLHQFGTDDPDPKVRGKWAVIDRLVDLIDGKAFASQGACVASFLRRHSILDEPFVALSLVDLRRPKPDPGIKIHKQRRVCILSWPYPYEIDLDEINSEADLLWWVRHLSEKNWMTAVRLHYVIDAIAEFKGFKIR